ncbi:MAG: DNA-directed RNA polymerase subunit L [Candidatus Methanofastidiosa archaeon]|nr:DNA-directed RNA polymerase subunit L [Candidatus Methanofastidiosa archaeon]
MELETIYEDGYEMEIRLHGESNTFANLLRGYLQKDEDVVFAAYKVPHPLLDSDKPLLKIRTNGKKTPKQALKDANKAILETIGAFKKEL